MEFCSNLHHLFNRKIRSHTFSSYYRLHNHEYWELTLNTEPLELVHNGNPSVFKPNTATIYRPNIDSHELHRGFHISIKLHDELFKELCQMLHPQIYDSLLNEDTSPSAQIDKLAVQDILNFYNNLFLIPNQPLQTAEAIYKISTISILKQFISQKYFNTYPSEYPAWIVSLIKDLRSPENFPLTIKEIIEKYHYTYTHTSRVFKQHVNQTLTSFFQQQKFKYACNLLTNTKMPIYEIASLIGYESPNHFKQTFKQIYSITPKEYRLNFNTTQ